MSDQDSDTTQSAKKSSTVNRLTSPAEVLKKAEGLYGRFVNHQLEHAVDARKSNISAAVEFFRNPVNQLETAVLLQEGVKLATPLLKSLLDPFNVPASRQNVDKRENEK